jgi:hypothetical protein
MNINAAGAPRALSAMFNASKSLVDENGISLVTQVTKIMDGIFIGAKEAASVRHSFAAAVCACVRISRLFFVRWRMMRWFWRDLWKCMRGLCRKGASGRASERVHRTLCTPLCYVVCIYS